MGEHARRCSPRRLGRPVGLPSRVRSYASRVNKMLGHAKVPDPHSSVAGYSSGCPNCTNMATQRDLLKAATDLYLASPDKPSRLSNLTLPAQLERGVDLPAA
jgi:hypothetical protein